jgi:hypothetical protein
MAVYENTLFAKLYGRRLEISVSLKWEAEWPTQLLQLFKVEVAVLTLQSTDNPEAFIGLRITLGDVPRPIGIRCKDLYESHGFITETIL